MAPLSGPRPPWPRPPSTRCPPTPCSSGSLASGLRGRGGGWFEAARKWQAVRVEGGEPLVVANGAEGEPGSFKDRHVMRHRPADVVAGLLLAARAVGAREAIVFLKGSFDGPAATLSQALRRGPARRALGRDPPRATTAT